MKNFSTFALLLLSSTGFSDVIWEPSKNCKSQQFGVWYSCSGENAPALLPNKATETNVGFLKTTPVTNTIFYDFKCSASRQFNVSLSTGTSEFPLLWNVTDQFRNVYKLSDQSTISYKLKFNPPNSSTGIKEGCAVDIISNVSVPDVDVLREYSFFLETSVSDLVSLQEDIDAGVELPAKWAVLKSSPDRIETVVTNLSIELSIYQKELADLQKDNSGSSEISDRIEVLISLIESFSVDIQTLNLLIKDIKDVTSVGTQCESTTPDAYCLAAATSLTQKINTTIEEKKNTVKDFNVFIDAEVLRLKNISATISNALRKIKVN